MCHSRRLLGVAIACSPLCTLAQTQPDPGGAVELKIELESHAHEASGTDVLTGDFYVYEDRVARAGRILELDVVVLPALSETPAPDPVFVFAGGPGQNAAHLWRGWVDHWMRRDRDIVLISQRGTGGNNRLDCSLPGSDDNLQGYLDPLFDTVAWRECAERLAQRADLSKYSTSLAMDDIDDARRALGYERINLYGGSYGSRAELVYIRRHPDAVRTAILNSVAPISFKNPLFHARAAQDALDLIFAQIEGDDRYRERFGDLRTKFWTVLDQLEVEPADATVTHPRTGEPVRVKLSRDGFAGSLRVAMYYNCRDVPFLIDRAFSGDFDRLAQRGLETARSIRNALALGMLMCVVCSEDIARIDPAEIAPATDGTFLGNVRVRTQMAACEFWPQSDVPEDYGEPVTSDVPVLLLSGTHDPVTPPYFGAEAAGHLSKSLHVVVPGTHGVGGPVVDGIMREFLESGTVRGLDVSGVSDLPAYRFNTER